MNAEVIQGIDMVQAMISTSFHCKEPFAEIITITPEIAEFLLLKNEANRKVSARKAKEYPKDMLAGRFDGLNGQTIVISKDGLLNDGQHRLTAVIKSGVPLRTFVVFGVDRESRMTIDQAKPRSGSDYLHMSGVDDANLVSNIVMLFNAWQKKLFTAFNARRFGSHHPGDNPTKTELLQIANKKMAILKEAIEAVPHKQANILSMRARLCAAYIILRETNTQDHVVDFFDPVLTGGGLNSGDARLTLRNKLIEDKSTYPSSAKTLATIITAWNAYVINKPTTKFRNVSAMPVVLSKSVQSPPIAQ